MTTTKKLLRAIPLVAALGAMGSVANATPISGVDGFGNPTVPGATSTITFDGQADATFSSLSLGGVTFSGIGGNLRTDNTYANQYNGRGTRYLDNNAGSFTSGIRFDFASTLSAFAFNWGASDSQWKLSAYDAANNLLESYLVPITYASNAGDYIGLADAGMTYATLINLGGSDWVFVDNFTIAGAAKTVPEPASMALLGVGLLGLRAARRRKQAA
jgi:hypothetical protein